MFDWSDQDQGGDSIWSEFSQNEDHIVPYPKDTEANTPVTFGDYSKRQRKEKATSLVRPIGQALGLKNHFPTCLENNSSSNTDVELSTPRLDMDTWPDLPALNTTFDNTYYDSIANRDRERGNMTECDHCGSMVQCKDASAQKEYSSISVAGTMQLDGEAGLFNNEDGDNEQDNFLDCDWGTIGDFDDLDKIFRNDSFFGHNTVGNGDEFLSPSTYVISSTAQSIPLPDLRLNSDQASDQGCLSFQLAEQSPEEKKGDSSLGSRGQILWQSNRITENKGTNNQLMEKEDKQTKLPRPKKKAEEKSKKYSKNFIGASSHNMEHSQLSLNQKTHPISLPEFQSPTLRQLGNVDPLGHFGSYNQSMLSGYVYPSSQFPAFPQSPYELSRPPTMTTQEKIEKLRRRQKMQAILAIQQQQEKFSQSTTSSIEASANRVLSSDLNMLVEHDESHISPLVDDHSLEEAIYYQLQDSLGQLNTGIRLCVRDSLFRLARSAMERQSANDGNSSNIIRDGDEGPENEETNSENRYIRMVDAETDTNHIDRTVARLLFSRVSDTCEGTVKEEIISQSPVSCNPAPKGPLAFGGKGERGAQPSV